MFKSTQDAIAQGLSADPARQFFYYGLRKRFMKLTSVALDRGLYDLAAMFACQSQFCREAYDAESTKLIVDRVFNN